MNGEIILTKDDEVVMKLLHYFITEKGYNPIILHGVNNEIWLENLENDYRIIRIVTNYIHNDEQLTFDSFKTKQIIKQIKKKTFSLKMNTLSIFLNLGDNVNFKDHKDEEFINSAYIKNINDLNEYKFITSSFPDITKNTEFKEKGLELFAKITRDIENKNQEEAMEAEEVFKPKKPIVTYILIALNVVIFFLMYILGKGSKDALTLLYFGASHPLLIKAGQIYRLLTSAFLHVGILHLLCNMYSLYIVGSQIESFLGKTKFLIIYLFSAIAGNLMSMLFVDTISAGASGAVFGLLGSLLYFGYHYRVYLGGVVKSQIVPLIIINLAIGFLCNGVNNAAHIGGLIGGVLISIALGVKHKTSNFERVNGLIMTIIYTAFLIYIAFIGM